jgi:hypothetical protein
LKIWSIKGDIYNPLGDMPLFGLRQDISATRSTTNDKKQHASAHPTPVVTYKKFIHENPLSLIQGHD